MLIWPKKLFIHKIWRWVSKICRILRWFRNCWEKCKKFANKKVTGKRSVQNWSLYSSLLQTCKSFWQITFSGYTFFKLFPRIWNQRKILRFLDTHMLKKFWGHGVHIWVFFGNSRMQIRKKWLNQLENFFYKHCKEYYLASFGWWIPSSCENHSNLFLSISWLNLWQEASVERGGGGSRGWLVREAPCAWCRHPALWSSARSSD